jgi:hypothetical protein
MKRIGFITDYRKASSPVRGALDELERSHDVRLETIEDFPQVESIAQATWGLINLVDIVVAYITKESGNLYYEIGLAHGVGKPVIIVADDSTSLPADLVAQRVVLVDPQNFPPENLAFRIREAIEEIERGRSLIGYRGPRDEPAQYPHSYSHLPGAPDFRTLFAYQGAARAFRFERWFADVARAVPGWEVIEAEKPFGKKQSFDLVIWNSREDYELRALGNPIAVELKPIRAMNSSMLSQFLHRARVGGLKAVVLATTSTNDARTKKLLARLREDEGINAIALDRDDLVQVTAPEILLSLIKKKTRELLYKEES